MSQTRLSADTSEEMERRQIEAWRVMTPAEKAATVTGLTQAVFSLAEAGIRHRHPRATDREVFLRMAVLVLGDDLARKVHPDIVALDPR